MARQIVVELLADATKMSRTMDDAGKSAQGLGSKFSSLRSAALPYIAVAAGVGAELVRMTKAASEDAAEQSKLAVTLENTVDANAALVKSVESYIEAAMKATTYTDSELRPAFGALVSETRNVEEAQKLMATAMDLAAAKNISVEEAANLLIKAHNGQTRGLRDLGVETKNAEDKAASFSSVMEDVNKVVGGQAEAALGTTEGKMTNLKNRFGELEEMVGAKLLPVLDKLTTWAIDEGIPAIEDFAKSLQPLLDLLGKVLPPLTAVISKIVSLGKFGIGGPIQQIGALAGLVGRVFHGGGVVPGSPGQTVPILAQAGERIIPAGGRGGGITINVHAGVVTPTLARDIAGLLRQEINRSGPLGLS